MRVSSPIRLKRARKLKDEDMIPNDTPWERQR